MMTSFTWTVFSFWILSFLWISFVNHCAALLAFSGVGLVFYFRDFQEPQNESHLLSCIHWTVRFRYKN